MKLTRSLLVVIRTSSRRKPSTPDLRCFDRVKDVPKRDSTSYLRLDIMNADSCIVVALCPTKESMIVGIISLCVDGLATGIELDGILGDEESRIC